jgi:hypothetical protein
LSASAATLEDVVAAVARLERKLDALARRRDRRLFSKRAAARLLGIDRGTTLERLIRDGHLRLVMGRVPDTEIERVLAEGIPEQKASGKRQPKPARDEAAAIRDLEV